MLFLGIGGWRGFQARVLGVAIAKKITHTPTFFYNFSIPSPIFDRIAFQFANTVSPLSLSLSQIFLEISLARLYII